MSILIRASALSAIMTDGKGKDELSVGAKTYVTKLAKEMVYGYDERISSKYIDKGIRVEDASIDLYNAVKLSSYAKNTERRNNAWLTGEADIVATHKIIDIKSSWCLTTFPVLSEQGEDKGYEWQLRAYMMLWDKPFAEIAYCLVSTPDDLIGWEAPSLHQVDHINRELRVTVVPYERDLVLEQKIKVKVEAARLYYDEMIREIANQHTF
ncbi:MAG: hypothetical protein ACOVKL_07915 [Polynucleobacter sp.]